MVGCFGRMGRRRRERKEERKAKEARREREEIGSCRIVELLSVVRDTGTIYPCCWYGRE